MRIGGSVSTPLPTSRSTNRLSSSLAAYDVAGRLVDQQVSQTLWLGRDYYPDGALTSELAHASGSTGTLSPHGISLWLLDARAENALSFWGDAAYCQNNHFRSLLRDESTRLLTEYRGEAENPSCTCESGCTFRDRFFLDTVRLGPWAVASYNRGSGIRLEARDHLGSPRFVTDASGALTSFVLLDSFGRPLAGSPSTRETFTGHERNHVSGDGNLLPLSDYMHARTYVPTWGRFTRPDPIDSFSLLDPQSFNRYAYVLNNPVKYVDPDGMRWENGRVTAEAVVTAEDPGEELHRYLTRSMQLARRVMALRRVASTAIRTGERIRQMACTVIPSGRVLGFSAGAGAIGAGVGGGEVVLNYRSGQTSAFGFGGVQVGSSGVHFGTHYSGLAFGLNDSNSNYSGGSTGASAGAAGGLFGQASSGGLRGGWGGLLPAGGDTSVTVVGAYYGKSLFGPSGGLSVTEYTDPLQLTGGMSFSVLDDALYLVNQVCQ